MFRRRIALALALALAMTVAAPAALAWEYYSARTPLDGSGDDRLHNIALAAQAIDGTEVAAGHRFSFNAAVGPRVSRRGYRTAPNGRGAPVTGGGVAQAATTLYLALLKLGGDVAIDPVKTYGSRFVDHYVDDPEQAVVTDYDAGIDLSFTNHGDDMTVEMWLEADDLCCAITVGDGPALFFELEGDGADDADDWFIASLSDSSPANDRRGLFGSASLDCGGDTDVLHNVRLAADSVNDTALESGDTFSFNDIVGPRTAGYGFRRAMNGRGVKVLGGGVAQVASALWLAIQDADDFAIVEKSTYGDKYNQHYVDSSYDAILTDYASGRDFSFRYTGQGTATLYAHVSGGRLYCDVYGN